MPPLTASHNDASVYRRNIRLRPQSANNSSAYSSDNRYANGNTNRNAIRIGDANSNVIRTSWPAFAPLGRQQLSKPPTTAPPTAPTTATLTATPTATQFATATPTATQFAPPGRHSRRWDVSGNASRQQRNANNGYANSSAYSSANSYANRAAQWLR